MWTIGNGLWSPLLARLFSAIANTGSVPSSFHSGSISPLPKPHNPDPTNPASYRPITLLPTLYRIFTRCLAKRFGMAMAPTFHPEQSAYIPGRRIEASILFQDLLGPLLRLRNQPGSSLFFDTVKAFNTVSHDFLFDSMSISGCSQDMVNFAKIVLSNTFAATHLCGYGYGYTSWS